MQSDKFCDNIGNDIIILITLVMFGLVIRY